MSYRSFDCCMDRHKGKVYVPELDRYCSAESILFCKQGGGYYSTSCDWCGEGRAYNGNRCCCEGCEMALVKHEKVQYRNSNIRCFASLLGVAAFLIFSWLVSMVKS